MFQALVNFGQWPCLFRVKGWNQLFKSVKTNIDIWHNLHIVTDNSVSITGESESWSDSSAVKGKINTWPSLLKQVIWFSVRESEGEKWCSDSLSERKKLEIFALLTISPVKCSPHRRHSTQAANTKFQIWFLQMRLNIIQGINQNFSLNLLKSLCLFVEQQLVAFYWKGNKGIEKVSTMKRYFERRTSLDAIADETKQCKMSTLVDECCSKHKHNENEDDNDKHNTIQR